MNSSRSIRDNSAVYPVVHEDLQHHASGCYSAHSGVKKWNRTAENRLLAAEKFSALAEWITGQPYSTEFDRAWKNVLFNQFHDILAGTSLEVAYDDARDQFRRSDVDRRPGAQQRNPVAGLEDQYRA